MKAPPASSKVGAALRVGAYAFFAITGLWILPPLMYPVGGMLIAAALGTFAAAAVANVAALRIYERRELAVIGMHWNPASRRNLLAGLGGGGGVAVVALGVPLITGAAELRPDPEFAAGAGTFIFVSLALLFGAVGEEMLFRGYGFQVLLGGIGPFATILPVSVLFGISHSGNPNASALALINTIGWGVVLGVGFLRSGDLWFPIGLHFGWNWVLAVAGANLSGFTMRIGGWVVHWKAGELWSGGAYGPEGGLIASLALIVLAFYLWKAPVRGQEAFLLRVGKEG